MAITPLNYCLSDRGQFVTDPSNARRTTRADMDAAFAAFRQRPAGTPLVVFFHGGLVSQQDAIKRAEVGVNGGPSLLDAYRDAGGYPYFFFWRTGAGETILDLLHDNLGSILGNEHVAGLIRAVHNSNTPANQALAQNGRSSATLDDAPPPTLEAKLEAYFKTDPDAQYFAGLLEAQPAMQPESLTEPVRAAGQPISDTEVAARIRSAIMATSAPPRVGRLSPRVVPIPLPIALFTAFAIVAYRVIRRTIQGRAHPGLCTATEEVLRAFFLASVGQELWKRMKQDSTDAFNAGSTYVGSAFLDCLADYAQANGPPRILLVGHSAGSIFVDALLERVTSRRMEPELVFDVVFLAAAIRDSRFDTQLSPQVNSRIAHFRSFGMTDSLEGASGLLEKTDAIAELVDLFYPASLLYLISGILEPDEVDAPLVGMQRYILNNHVYAAEPGVVELEAYVAVHPDVWSPTSATTPIGYRCQASFHDGFPNDPQTLQSVTRLIQSWV